MSRIPAIFLLTGVILPTISGQSLSAEYLDVKLPSPNVYPVPYFDGNDSIYLFGGCFTATETAILKFSISSETLTKVGQLPGRSCTGTVQSDNFGHIFYFGGSRRGNEVYVFDPATNISTIVATLPDDIQLSVSLKPNDSWDTVFILGGIAQSRELLAIDLESLNYSIISTNLSFNVFGGASIRVGNKAFIFVDSGTDESQAVELNLDTLELRKVGPATLPIFQYYPSAVWDGNFCYIVGGYRSGNLNGIIQFNVDTYANNFMPVSNFLVDSPNFFYTSPASVFVPSRNRIYLFGGSSYNNSNGRDHDEIFYIDLSPLDQTTSTTELTSSTILNPEFSSMIDEL